jgi:hypothetical protein
MANIRPQAVDFGPAHDANMVERVEMLARTNKKLRRAQQKVNRLCLQRNELAAAIRQDMANYPLPEVGFIFCLNVLYSLS